MRNDDELDATMIVAYGQWNLDIDRFRRRLGQDLLDRIVASMC